MKPRVRLLAVTMPVDDTDYEDSIWPSGAEHATPLTLIEFAGRWDYGQKSVDKMGDGDDPLAIIERWLTAGEESMVEMVDAVFLITCSRVVSHELVRHRIASYQQESQRFVKYDEEAPDDLFFVPPEVAASGQSDVYRAAMTRALSTYNLLRSMKVSPQIARYVLPNATRTRIIAKMNLREWRHVLRLRMHTSAQPEIREIAAVIQGKLKHRFGSALFPDDIAAVRSTR